MPVTTRTAPDRILDAAERCMARYGLRVSMRDVAAEAGLSRGSVYRYYADRDALVAAVLARTAERFVAASATAVDSHDTLADQVAEPDRLPPDQRRGVGAARLQREDMAGRVAHLGTSRVRAAPSP